MKPMMWLPLLLLVFGVTGASSDRSELMQKKMKHAENIFRYLALGDLAKVEFEASELERITVEAGYGDEGERYREYADEFVRIVRTLHEDAQDRNMAGSYYAFSRMTGMCFSCHDHIRDSKD